MIRALYLYAPFYAMGEKVDFVYLIATMPGRHSGDQVHKVKKAAAPSLLYFRCSSSLARPTEEPNTGVYVANAAGAAALTVANATVWQMGCSFA